MHNCGKIHLLDVVHQLRIMNYALRIDIIDRL